MPTIKLSVVLLTYNRLEYAKRTLKSFINNIAFDGDIHYHIADDGTGAKYVKDISSVFVSPITKVTNSDAERGGYGKNYNLAMQVAHSISDYVIPLEDDWELIRELDINAVIEDMQQLNIGCARLGYIGYTQELRATFKYGSRLGNWLVFDSESPEPHVFAGHPRIESVEWERKLGPWPEGMSPGTTEFTVAKRKESRMNVGWPIEYVRPSGDMFAHIGTVRSY